MPTNAYSATWFDLFMRPISPEQTEREINFVARNLPQPPYQMVLDLCCGTGRHARHLATLGYHVLGVDANPSALDQARRLETVNAHYAEQDMRQVAELPGVYDAALSMWQSFGYFDAATNQDVLNQIARKLRPGGRCIVDVYHRMFFEGNQGTRQFEREGLRITEAKRMVGDRLTVRLDYGDGRGDMFDWQLYTPEELISLASTCGFRGLLACSDFDEASPPSAEKPRMQLVLEKSGL